MAALALMVCRPVMGDETGSQAPLEPASSTSTSTVPVAVMTFNIRTSLGRDGSNHWAYRKGLVAETIRHYAPDVVGLQEALGEQIQFLDDALPDYRWLGVDRGLNGGMGLSEATPIFYRFGALSPIESGTFWLSDTPALPTPGRRPSRIVTWARFYHTGSGAEVYVFNTHLSMRGGRRHVTSVQRILTRIDALPEHAAAIVTGDFNSTAEVSEAWHEATAGRLTDAWTIAKDRLGPAVTWSGFQAPRNRESRIDWVLVGGPVAVQSMETVVFTDGVRYPSDHFPVYAELAVGVPSTISGTQDDSAGSSPGSR